MANQYLPTPHARTRTDLYEDALVSLSLCFVCPSTFDNKVGIIYHDLKPENVLLAADGHVKVTNLPGKQFCVVREPSRRAQTRSLFIATMAK